MVRESDDNDLVTARSCASSARSASVNSNASERTLSNDELLMAITGYRSIGGEEDTAGDARNESLSET